MEKQEKKNENFTEEKQIKNKESFVKFLAWLIQKYGDKVLEKIN